MGLPQKVRSFLNNETATANQIRQLLKISVLIILFIGLFWFVDFRAVVGVIARADPLLLVIGLLLVLSTINCFLSQAGSRKRQEWLQDGVYEFCVSAACSWLRQYE